jgi:hypothetical protein
MSNYTKTTDFASKDTLNPGDPNKIVRGTEFDTEFNNIAIASATKADKDNPSFEGNVSVNGNITVPVNATIDGRDVSVDGTKLDGIEAGADVTDTANVTAAGAVMDSELTNITAVKTLNQVVNTTSDVNFNTVDGRDVSVDGAKLDTVEASADVTDTANVTAAGALMDSELTNITAVKTLNQGVATTDSPTFAGATLGAVTYAATDGTDGQVLMTNGSGVAAFEDMPSSTYLDVTDFGATGDGSDQTTFIQNAINHASTRGIQTIFFPEGHYKYTTLRFYHDQTDNTAFQGTNLFIGDSTNGTNGTATFNFGWYIADASDLTVTVEGVEQTIVTDYTVSGVGSDTGGTVTFTAGNVPLVPTTSYVTTLSGSVVDGVATREFYYPEGVPVPNGSNVSVTVGGSATTAYALDIGKRLVVFNVGSEPPVGTNNVVITIQKTINIASNGRDGKFQLRGTGRLAISDLVGLDKNRTRLYGSVLESTGDGIIIDTDQEFGTPVDARNFVAKDLTFLADNTGQIIKAEKNPGMSFDTCSFKQFNIAGSALEVRNCWFFTMNQCYVVGQRYTNSKQGIDSDGNVVTSYPYTFDNPSATSDILVQLNGGALTETTDYTVTMGTTKTVTLTQAGINKINTAVALSGAKTVDVQRINTGDGISSQFVGRTFGNFAGLWTITQSLIDSFGNGVHWTGGTVTNLSIRDSAIQNCGNYNIYADAGIIQQMLLDNVYMENQKTQGVSFIKGDGVGTASASIRSLKMTNCFFLGGGTNPRITGPCIDLNSVEDISIEGMYVFRPRQTFLNVADTKNSQNISGEIKNSVFTSDFEQTKFLNLEPTIYLLTGILPNVHNCVWPGFESGFYNTTNNILLFDSTVESNFLRQYTDFKGTTGTAKFGFGDTKVVTGITSGPYNITGSDSRTYYDLTHSIDGGLKVKLPDTGEANDGRLIIVKNNEDSTSRLNYPYINVVNNSADLTTIAQLSPGQAGLFIMDKQDGNKFKYAGRTFTNDLKMANNHEISFGDGTRDAETTSPAAGTVDLTYTFDSPDSAAQLMVERKLSGETFVRTFDFTVDLATKTVTLDSATVANEEVKIAKSVNDMRIYHQSSDSTNRIDTIGGLTIDDITYPTADGNSGQVLATNGSGTLSFTNASQGGLAHVVDDTTPQLGGDLESNGNDILFADNDKAIFGAGSDLSIFHDGSSSVIRDSGTGNLAIQAEDFAVQSSDASATHIFVDASSGYTALNYGGSTKLNTSSTGIDVTGTINTVLSVNGTTEDVFITGAQPALEFVESDNSGSRMRMAWETSGSFKPTLYQSLYGDTTTTYGGINIQTKTSDGLSSHVVYSYDPINDRNFWGTRGSPQDVAMQLESDGTFNVRGGDVSFEDSSQVEKFYWDASESRLGLGTTSPAAALDVTNGHIKLSAGYSLQWDDTHERIEQSNGNLEFFTNNSQQMTISGGNVGIGTSLPDRQLSVNDFSGNGTVSINASTTGASTLYFADGNTGTNVYTGFIQYNHSIDAMQFAVNGGTERMRIDSSGRVGIGTSSPNLQFFNNLVVGNDASGDKGITIRSNAANRGVLAFSDTDSATDGRYTGFISYDHSDNAMKFHTNGGNERMRITSAGGVEIKSNSGSISHKFDYNENGGEIQLIDDAGAVATLIDQAGNNTRILELINGSNMQLGLGASNTTGDIIFMTAGNVPSARFDSSGNFGIGASSLSNGKLTLEGVDGGSSAGIYFNNTSTNGKSYSLSSGNSGEFMLYDRTSNAYRLFVNSSGDLLVGTTTGSGTTGTYSGFGAYAGGNIFSSSTGRSIFARRSSDGSIIDLRRDGTTVGSIGCNNNDPYIARAGGSGFRWYSGAVVPTNDSGATADNAMDLGSSTGRFKDLHLSGTARASTYRLQSGSTTTGGLFHEKDITGSGSSVDTTVYAETGNAIHFMVNGSATPVGTFDTSGNFLAGTTASRTGNYSISLEPNNSLMYFRAAGTGSIQQAIFVRDTTGTPVSVGSIATTGTATAYNVSSDERLKENIVDAPSASDDIDALQVRSFDWKINGEHQKYGMVAQELNTVAPEAVTIPDDPEEMAGVDYSKLVPMLVKEIQSLRARVAQLEND